ncbi:MAG: DUF1850 domain-containing protein [Spirochaetia bacterium]|nr:DUF1850 domain-containing protein [Spirochaetia bacterium]
MALAAALLYRLPGPWLRLGGADGRPLATLRVEGGFWLGYIHSINLSPVDEYFTVDADGLLTLRELRFDQFGTGMPSGDDDGFAVENGRFVTRPGRRFRIVQAAVSPVPGHRLSTGSGTWLLTRWAPVGGLLSFSAATLAAHDKMNQTVGSP